MKKSRTSIILSAIWRGIRVSYNQLYLKKYNVIDEFDLPDPQDIIAAISQTILSEAFSWIKSFIFDENFPAFYSYGSK